jgi:hypothetical protein
MVSDLECLMDLKEKIEKNGLKNDYYKKRYEKSNKFDYKTK